MSVPVTEGTFTHDVPGAGKPCTTWYEIHGDLKSGVTPLITLHGGPGVSHLYISSLADLALQGIPVIFYDQVGCGNSTRLPEKNGDVEFWKEDIFVEELNKLVAHLGLESYDVFGHSWGGMLGAVFAARQPKGLRRLVIADSPADAKLWVEAVNKLLERMPQSVQDTLKKHEADGTYDEEEYKEAVGAFYKQFLLRMDPWPEAVVKAFALLDEDNTVYLTMWGPSEFHVTGNLKTWSAIDECRKINVPTLLLNGRYDEAQDSCVVPFFKNIPKVKWYTFAQSAHMPHWDEREHFMEVVGDFLK